MSESEPRILAEDISIRRPLDDAMLGAMANYDVPTHDLMDYSDRFRRETNRNLDTLDMAITMSRPESRKPVVGLHETADVPQAVGSFVVDAANRVTTSKPQELSRKELHGRAREYSEVRKSSVQKFGYDRKVAERYLSGLGPTNSLRQPDGYDAAFEMSRIKHLLEDDYHAMPEKWQKPELRMTEGLLAEELALLWRPEARAQAAHQSHPEAIANVNDPNVFTEEELLDLTDAQRWLIVGATLCEEAAGVFEQVYKSKTASLTMRTEAFTRGVDMQLRALRLRYHADTDNAPQYEVAYQKLAKQHAKLMLNAWDTLHATGAEHAASEEREAYFGLVFEANVVAHERLILMQKGEHKKTHVRLSMPREDTISVGIAKTNTGQRVNVSSDVVLETLGGRKIRSLQAKATKEKWYKPKSAYPEELIKMRFQDSPGYGALGRHQARVKNLQ